MKVFVCLTDDLDKPVCVHISAITKVVADAYGGGKMRSVIWLVDGTNIVISMPLADLFTVLNGQ